MARSPDWATDGQTHMTPSKELSAAGPSHFQPGRPLQWPFYSLQRPMAILSMLIVKVHGRFIKADGRFIKESFDAVFPARLGSRT